MKIIVEILMRKRVVIDVEQSYTVSQVRDIINQIDGNMLRADVRLYYEGKYLDMKKTLADYKIGPISFLVVTMFVADG